MSPPSRRQKIETLLADDPSDPFLRYSLALELAKEGDHDRSLQGLRALTQNSPPYVPAFFMAGQQLVKLGRIEDARSILRDGVEEARRQHDDHAAGEMAEFLTSLGDLA